MVYGSKVSDCDCNNVYDNIDDIDGDSDACGVIMAIAIIQT